MNKKKILATLVMLSLMQGSVYAEDKELEQANLHYTNGYSKEYDSVSIKLSTTGYIDKKNYDVEDFRPNEGTLGSNPYEQGTGIVLTKDSNLSIIKNLNISVIPDKENWGGSKIEMNRRGIRMADGSTLTVGGNTSILIDNYIHTSDKKWLDSSKDLEHDYGLDAQQGIFLEDQDTNLNLDGNLEITMLNGNRSMGILANNNASLTVGGNTTINVKNAPYYTYGISNFYDDHKYGLNYRENTAKLHFKGNLTIETDGGNNSIGINLKDSGTQKNDVITVDGHLDITAKGASEYKDRTSAQVFPNSVSNYGIYMYYIGSSNFNTADIKTISSGDDVESIGTYAYWYSDATFDGDVKYTTEADDGAVAISALARAGSNLEYKKGLIANGKIVLNAVGNTSNKASTINVNSTSDINSLVQLNGNIVVGKTEAAMVFGDKYDTAVDADITQNIITANLLNANSYFTGVNEFGNKGSKINLTFDNGADWNMTDSTTVTDLVLSNGADLNVNYDKANTTDYRSLTAENFTGEGGIVNLDIDASTNVNNSDRVYVDGTHRGTHYITLNNVGANTDGAEGTVLVSVNDEQGEFEANDSEGALYWNRYDLDFKESTTDGYNTDWYLKEVEQLDEPTTSVDTILGANALGYHTWRAETDKLMKRMGDLRHNGEDEKGAWFRVRGAEISRDGEASFENKYTVYELGYDEITKKTDRFTRYQGAALSYIDGTSSFARGSGENDGKSIAFYTTEMRNKGHYLDLVFRIADMDSDYKVYDTNGNKITGEPENVGVSLSAEYGRKKVMDDNGWYIEPQGQLTVGYFGGDNYRAKYADQYIDVHQSGIPSVLGRIGFNIGRDIDENTNIYLKANLLHEFCGDYDVDMVDSAGNRRTESDTFNDTWFEYGIGAAIKTGKNNHLYFDFEKTAGGDFEKDWAWNAGMRWTF